MIYLFGFSVASELNITAINTMDLQQLFEKRLQKIDHLNDFIVLYGKKDEILPDLREISNETEHFKDLLTSCKDLLTKFQNENNQKCRELIESAREHQILMLDILDQVTDSDFDRAHQPSENSASPCQREESHRPITVLSEISNTPTPCKFGPFKHGEQPIMTLADYIKSPYATKRMRPLALQFTDFEKSIGADEFARIPRYAYLYHFFNKFFFCCCVAFILMSCFVFVSFFFGIIGANPFIMKSIYFICSVT